MLSETLKRDVPCKSGIEFRICTEKAGMNGYGDVHSLQPKVERRR